LKTPAPQKPLSCEGFVLPGHETKSENVEDGGKRGEWRRSDGGHFYSLPTGPLGGKRDIRRKISKGEKGGGQELLARLRVL